MLWVSVSRGLHRLALWWVLLLFYTKSSQKSCVERVDIGIEDDGVEVPYHDCQGGEDGLIQMNRRSDVEPAFGEESYDQGVGPKEGPGSNHDDRTPDHGPVFGLLDVTVRRPGRRVGTQAEVVGEACQRLARVIHFGQHLFPVMAQLAVGNQ